VFRPVVRLEMDWLRVDGSFGGGRMAGAGMEEIKPSYSLLFPPYGCRTVARDLLVEWALASRAGGAV
jgi:hypothetical protein